MRVLIPYKKKNAKSRLSPVLSLVEREQLVELMLRDVVNALYEANITSIDVLTTSEYGSLADMDVNYVLDSADLNKAINKYLEKAQESILIIMADVPLVTPKHIEDIVSLNEDIVIVPGKGGGTNLLFIKNPIKFSVCYYGMSFLNHCLIAAEKCQSFKVYDSFLLSTDIDEPQDIAEILLHGHGLSFEYVQKKFELEGGRARVKLIHIP
jgi:2-phospho-L-lactate/phosphoenolpyruvate guanylyltransferase